MRVGNLSFIKGKFRPAAMTSSHRPQLPRHFPATINRKPQATMAAPPVSSSSTSAAAAGSCKVVLANSIAKSLLTEVTADIKSLARSPRLHGFLANKDPAARMYADWTAKTCKEKLVDKSIPTYKQLLANTLQVESTLSSVRSNVKISKMKSVKPIRIPKSTV